MINNYLKNIWIKRTLLSLFILSSLFTSACFKEENITLLPMPLIIAVAPFNQPVYDAQLLAGYIPSEQSKIDSVTMAQYDALFKEKLEKTHREYIFLSHNDLQIDVQTDSKGRKNVLSTWAKLAENVGAEFIIVPQILDFEERKGEAIRVQTPARLLADFYLIRVKSQNTETLDGFLQTRSYYKEISYIDYNLNYDSPRISSRQKEPVVTFAKEAMNKAIREFHL